MRGRVIDGLNIKENRMTIREKDRLDAPQHFLVTSVRDASIYDQVHLVLGHLGEKGMVWHRQHSIRAAYSAADAATPRPVCGACVRGTMRHASTDHLRVN